MPKFEHSQFALDTPMFGYQARTVEYITLGRKGSERGLGLGRTIQVVAYQAGRAILEIDPGLGKSRISIESYLKLCPGEPVLVACSKKALNTWRREFPKWTTATSEDIVIVEGTPAKRKKLWAKKSQIKVVTYQSGMRDKKEVEAFGARMIIADECKLLVNRKTQACKFWSKIMHNTDYVIPMDGTLTRRGPQDLWALLNIINRKLYSSYWRFVKTFCIVVEGPFGQEIVGAQNTKALATQLSKCYVKLKDSDPDVDSDRPPLTRDFKLVEMNKQQERIYNDLTEDLLAVTDGGEVVATPSQLALQIRQRQLLICPKIIDPKMGHGAAIDQLLLEMEDDPHVVIFTPFAKALPFISSAVMGAGHPEPYVLKGGTNSEGVGRVENEFNSAVGRDRATICTIGFAESFELWSAKSGHFIGYEWAQRYNYQAEKRLHRLITPHPINIWYYRYMGTVDDVILNKLNQNQANVNLTFREYMSAIREARING